MYNAVVYCFLRNSFLLKIWSAIWQLFGLLSYFICSSFRISNYLSRSLVRIDLSKVMLLRRSCPSSFRRKVRLEYKSEQWFGYFLTHFESSVTVTQNRIVSHFWHDMRWYNFLGDGKIRQPKMNGIGFSISRNNCFRFRFYTTLHWNSCHAWSLYNNISAMLTQLYV